MAYYTTPDTDDAIRKLELIAASGRIMLDNSAVTLPIGARQNGKVTNLSLFDVMLQLAVEDKRDVLALLENQQKYAQELNMLADSQRLFTVEEVVRYEMRQLKEKSERYSHLFSFTKEFNEQMRVLEKNLGNFLHSLQKNIPSPKRPYFFDRIMKQVNSIKLYNRKEPSAVDKKIFATAVYESCANRERINVLTNDTHLLELLLLYTARNTGKNDILGDVHCYMFDNNREYMLAERKVPGAMSEVSQQENNKRSDSKYKKHS